jgi:hypothetical protein
MRSAWQMLSLLYENVMGGFLRCKNSWLNEASARHLCLTAKQERQETEQFWGKQWHSAAFLPDLTTCGIFCSKNSLSINVFSTVHKRLNTLKEWWSKTEYQRWLQHWQVWWINCVFWRILRKPSVWGSKPETRLPGDEIGLFKTVYNLCDSQLLWCSLCWSYLGICLASLLDSGVSNQVTDIWLEVINVRDKESFVHGISSN